MSNTVIALRQSGETSNTPSLGVLANGELALNFADSILYFKTAANTLGTILTATPGGLDTEVQFNDAGSFGGDSGFTYNKTTNTLTIDQANIAGLNVGIVVQSSFDKANAANILAQAAFNAANSVSNVLAQAAFDKANTANVTAEAGFAKANSSNVLAQAAFNFANTANIKVDAAFSKANAANVIAEAGFSKANTANVLAQASFNQANSANVLAQAGFNKANTANVTAEAGFAKANSANVLAQAAFDKANTDVTTISTTAGTYANASHVPVITLAANGRVSSIVNTSIAIAASQVTSGTLPIARGGTNQTTYTTGAALQFNGTSIATLANTGTAGTYANASHVPVITTDVYGRVSGVTNTAISFPVTSVAGATGAISNAQILSGILTVDGAGSGLDADLLDGLTSTSFANATFAQASFNFANTANIKVDAAFSKANAANVIAEAGFAKANAANVLAQAAFNFANTANIKVDAAFSKANAANVTAEAGFAKANSSNVLAQAAFNFANTANIKVDAAFSKANAANVLAQAAFNNSNTKFNSSGGTISGDVFVTGNLFPSVDNTGVVGNAANTWSNGQFTNLTIDSTLTVASLRGYSSLVGTASSATTTFVVTVASKTSNHRYFGTGSGSAYFIDGIESPFLTLLPGKTYRFTQEDGSNSTHQLLFYYTADKTTQYTTNVTTSGSAGSVGAYTEIVVTDTTPVVLHYQCVNHGYMGNAAQFNSNVVDTPYEITARGGINVGGINVSSVLTSAFNHANGSFDKANSANILAQAAFNAANSASSSTDSHARVTANAAFDKANSANVLAQASFNFANTANIKVDAAFSKANAANVLAQAGFSKANTANVTAEAGFAKANSANVLAQAAFNFANTVSGGAAIDNVARSQANTAIIQANTAITLAQAAFNAANNAATIGDILAISIALG